MELCEIISLIAWWYDEQVLTEFISHATTSVLEALGNLKFVILNELYIPHLTSLSIY